MKRASAFPSPSLCYACSRLAQRKGAGGSAGGAERPHRSRSTRSLNDGQRRLYRSTEANALHVIEADVNASAGSKDGRCTSTS